MQPLSENMNQIDRKTLQLVFRAIRTAFKRSDAYKLIKAENESFDVGTRGGKRWFCAFCGVSHIEVEVDHYPKPVIALDRKWFTYSVDEFYGSVFFLPCRVLCKPCHKLETKNQNQMRKQFRKG